jgi:hypothetical protein
MTKLEQHTQEPIQKGEENFKRSLGHYMLGVHFNTLDDILGVSKHKVAALFKKPNTWTFEQITTVLDYTTSNFPAAEFLTRFSWGFDGMSGRELEDLRAYLNNLEINKEHE